MTQSAKHRSAAKYLVMGSFEAYSGKSAILLGLAHQLKARGLDLAYSKPLGGSNQAKFGEVDGDVTFIQQILGLPDDRMQPPLLTLDVKTVQQHLTHPHLTTYAEQLQQQAQDQEGDLVLLEGPGTLNEGRVFNLALLHIAQQVQGPIVLVFRYHSMLLLDQILGAHEQLGDFLLGVIINDVPEDQFETVTLQVRPFLEERSIQVFGVLPSSTLLRSLSVAELVYQLNAEVLCRPDRLDLMVESLTIGAMNVNSALKYFCQRHNMAVVTGGDRTDLQLAALETSTQCLILTGHIPPTKDILTRAEEMEVPILSVDLDTLTTVEIIDRAFGQVRVHEPIKVECICQMTEEYLDIDRLVATLTLNPSPQGEEL